MIKKFLTKKYNQKDINIPLYIIFMMACYVIWQMGVIWLDANNSIIESANNISHNFMGNLSIFCVIISLIAIITFIIKPKVAYKSCLVATILSLLATLVLLTNNFVEECLYIQVGCCSVMSLASLVIYLYTYNSQNLKRQVIIESLGVGIISLLLHNDVFKMPFLIYNLISIILLIIFLIGLLKITDLDIKKINTIKKQNNKPLYLGIILLIIIFNIAAVFGANIVNQIKYGTTLYFIGHIIGSVLYYILNKTKINKSYIPSIYVAVFIIALGSIYITKINIYASFLLGMANSMFFALPYYCNLVYKNTFSKTIYIILNIIGIFQVALMDYLLNLTNNNMQLLISIYAVISIISLAILFIINNDLNNRFHEMLKGEKKENVFLYLSESEKNIAGLLLKDYSNSEIAHAIYLSPNTVKFHIKNIFRKLNITSRKELIKLINN